MQETELPTLDLNLEDLPDLPDPDKTARTLVPDAGTVSDEAKRIISAAREALAPMHLHDLCARAGVMMRRGVTIIEKLIAERQLIEVAGRRGRRVWVPEYADPPMPRVTIDATPQACAAAVAAIYLRDALVKRGCGDVAAALDNARVRRSFLEAVMVVVRAESVERFDYSTLAGQVEREAIASGVVS